MDIFTAAKDFGVFSSGIIIGLVLGAAWEIIRILRSIIPHPKAAVFIEDFISVMIFSLVLFTFSAGTVGMVRGYIILSFIAGFLAERFALGNNIIRLFKKHEKNELF